MRATVKVLTSFAALGMLLLNAPLQSAQAHPWTNATSLAAACTGQANANDQALRRQEAEKLLRSAREAMKSGKLNVAESLISKAEQLKPQYDALVVRLVDTPAKARRDLQALKSPAPPVAPASVNRPDSQTPRPLPAPPKSAVPFKLPSALPTNTLPAAPPTTPARGSIRDGAIGRGPALAPGNNNAGSPAVDRASSFQPALPESQRPVPPVVDSKKNEALRLIALARSALKSGDPLMARKFATQAEQLNVPDNAFAGTETRPWELQLEINKALNRPSGNVARAGGNLNDTSRVTTGVYRPDQDPTRVVPAQAPGQPTPAIDARVPETPRPTAMSTTRGQDLYQQGVRALQRQDRETAMKFFREAWQYQSELDPRTRQQLKDKLTLTNNASTAAPLPGGVQPSPLQQVDTAQNLLRQKLYREIMVEEKAAQEQSAADPHGALVRLQKLRDRIAANELDPASKTQLVSIVDRTIRSLEQYIQQNRVQIDLDQHNANTLQAIETDRLRNLEVQNKIAELVEQFETLVDEERYDEAEMIAKQAREIAPDMAVVQTLVSKSRLVRRLAEVDRIQQLREEGVVSASHSVLESSAPFDDRNPLLFGHMRDWEKLSRTRRQMLTDMQTSYTPAEIEIRNALKEKVDVRFTDRPLQEVLDTLGNYAGINIVPDQQGLSAERVTGSTPVTMNLNQPISLRAALNLILSQLNLSYVIQDEVLLITSKHNRDSDVKPRVYQVADLVIPIPNFVPSYNLGLPGILRESYRMLGYGGPPQGSGVAPLTMAANETQPSASASNASVLAQMGASGALNSLGVRPQNPGQFGAGGLGGGTGADFDSLIELITSTVSPDSWDEVGGPGSVESFEGNLSLVISQTQEVHEQIADLLEQLRRLQDLQVTIEVRFITLTDQFFERIGVDFDFDIDDNTGLSQNEVVFFDDDNPSTVVGLDPDGFPTADLDLSFSQGSFNTALPQFGGFDPATAANFGFAILSDIEVFFLLQAAQGDNRTNVLQAPKVTLFNGQQASVSDTSQRPFVVSVIPVVGDFAAAQQPVIAILGEGTTLNVQAVVSSDRRYVRVTMVPFFSRIGDVDEFTFQGSTTSDTGTNEVVDADDNTTTNNNNNFVTRSGTTVQLPTFAFTTVTTTVSVPDGGTVLLGGIKRLSEGRDEEGLPILSKLPYINRLFRNVGIGRETSSLMMMVTPRIIIQEEEELAQTGYDSSDN